MDINQLWAQIYEMYQAGEPWELTPQERFAQEEINQGYTADSPVTEYLNKLYDWDPEWSENQMYFTPTVDILDDLKLEGLHGNDRANMMEISTVLKRERLAKSRVKQLHGFFGIRKKSLNITINANGNEVYAKRMPT